MPFPVEDIPLSVLPADDSSASSTNVTASGTEGAMYKQVTLSDAGSDSDDDANSTRLPADYELVGFMPKPRTAGLFNSFLNMSSSIIGAGIIGLAYALRQAGFFSGVFLIFALTWLVDWTLVLLIRTGKITSTDSYISLVRSTFGTRGVYLVSIFQFCMAFGGMCAYNVIIGDTIPPVLRTLFHIDHSGFLAAITSRRFIIFILTACITFPLSLYRDVAKLAKASALALISLLVIVTAVVVQAPLADDSLRGSPDRRWSIINVGIFQSIGVISFAFVCHHNSFIIVSALKKPTLDRSALVAHLSTGVSLVMSLILSVAGYMVFTERTQANVLNNFSSHDSFINAARLAFGMNMFATFPLEHFVAREVVEEMMLNTEQHSTSQREHVLITSALVGTSLLISLLTCDLGLVLELSGGFSACALAYVLPPACYLKATADRGRPWYHRRSIGKWACIGFGLTVMAISTSQALWKVIVVGSKHQRCHW